MAVCHTILARNTGPFVITLLRKILSESLRPLCPIRHFGTLGAGLNYGLSYIELGSSTNVPANRMASQMPIRPKSVI